MAVGTRDHAAVGQYDSRGNLILSEGMTGGSVSWLNQTLGYWGYQGGTGDVYDASTAAAVRAFQTKYGYPATGVMDEATWGLMDALARGEAAPPAPGSAPAAAPAAPGTTPTAQAPQAAQPSPSQRDALARVTTVLNQYGLGGLTEWAKAKLLGGATEAEIQLELYDQEAFKARFPVIAQRQAAGLPPVSVGQVLEYEQRGREILRAAGITNAAFTTPEYLQGLMAKDVSLAEVQTRVQDGLLKVSQAPPEVREAFASYFGASGDSALAALFLDPSIAAPELEKMAMTAVAGGIGARFGVQLAQGIAREIADTGVSDAGIWQGFAQIDSIRALFEESISETTDLTAEAEGVGAVFNTVQGATALLENRARSRTAAFRGGGGSAVTEQGAVGLGVADA